MKTLDFISSVFVQEFERMTLDTEGFATHPFVGFSMVCQAIEILGACFDEYEWDDRNLSELRFRLAISKLFPEKYSRYNSKGKIDLYKNLRCPMIHQMRPGRFINLSERKHELEAKISNSHLTEENEMLVLMYEDFFKDFKNACEKVVEMIKSNSITSGKAHGHNISIPNDKN